MVCMKKHYTDALITLLVWVRMHADVVKPYLSSMNEAEGLQNRDERRWGAWCAQTDVLQNRIDEHGEWRRDVWCKENPHTRVAQPDAVLTVGDATVPVRVRCSYAPPVRTLSSGDRESVRGDVRAMYMPPMPHFGVFVSWMADETTIFFVNAGSGVPEGFIARSCMCMARQESDAEVGE